MFCLECVYVRLSGGGGSVPLLLAVSLCCPRDE